MTTEEVLKYIRNHSSEVRGVLLYVDTTLNSLVEGHIEAWDGIKNTLNSALDVAKDKIDDMEGVLDDLE